jgi:hypothetical protein
MTVCWVVCGNLSVVGVEERGREGTVPDSRCSSPYCPQFIMFMRRPQRPDVGFSYTISNLHTCVLNIISAPTHSHNKYASTRMHTHIIHTHQIHTNMQVHTHTHTHTHIQMYVHIHTPPHAHSLTLQGCLSHVPSARDSCSLPCHSAQHCLQHSCWQGELAIL